MRILGICGSLASSSANLSLLQTAARLAPAGSDAVVVGEEPIVRGPGVEAEVGALLAALVERVREARTQAEPLSK